MEENFLEITEEIFGKEIVEYDTYRFKRLEIQLKSMNQLNDRSDSKELSESIIRKQLLNMKQNLDQNIYFLGGASNIYEEYMATEISWFQGVFWAKQILGVEDEWNLTYYSQFRKILNELKDDKNRIIFTALSFSLFLDIHYSWEKDKNLILPNLENFLERLKELSKLYVSRGVEINSKKQYSLFLIVKDLFGEDVFANTIDGDNHSTEFGIREELIAVQACLDGIQHLSFPILESIYGK